MQVYSQDWGVKHDILVLVFHFWWGIPSLVPDLVLGHRRGEAPTACSQLHHLQTAASALHCLLLSLSEGEKDRLVVYLTPQSRGAFLWLVIKRSKRCYLIGCGRLEFFRFMRYLLQRREVLFRCQCEICVAHNWKVYRIHGDLTCVQITFLHLHMSSEIILIIPWQDWMENPHSAWELCLIFGKLLILVGLKSLTQDDVTVTLKERVIINPSWELIQI